MNAIHDLVTRFADWTHRHWHDAHDRLLRHTGGLCDEPDCPVCGTGVPLCRRCWDREGQP